VEEQGPFVEGVLLDHLTASFQALSPKFTEDDKEKQERQRVSNERKASSGHVRRGQRKQQHERTSRLAATKSGKLC